MQLNGERVVPRFPSAEPPAASAAMARSAISKMKMVGCFHFDFAMPLRSNLRADSRPRRDKASV